MSLEFDQAEARYAAEPANWLTPEALFEQQWARALIDRGLILPFADDRRSAFFYPDPAGGLARYVVYGRFPEPPDPDDAERREPAARRAHLVQ